jgi:PmbA protein
MVVFGRQSGADEVEVTVVDGREFSVDVRLGKVEALTEAGARHLSVRVIKDLRTAYASSSDLDRETLRRLIRNAVERSALASQDPCSALPELSSERVAAAALKIFDPRIRELGTTRKIGLALETEGRALEDKRITNSHGASFATNEITTVLANSRGFLGSYDQTFCSLSVGLQAGGTDDRAEDYWSSAQRFFHDLETPESVARRAVERTVRQLHPRKIRTREVPVIFEPLMTEWLLGFLFACVSGVAVYQKATFLAEKLKAKIGSDLVNVIDDGLLPGKLGSRPFDTEGVACRKTKVLVKGVLRRFICNTYAGRKLNLPTTGNADGTGVSPNNFYLAPGMSSPQEILASTRQGLLLTRTIGHGLNPVTGDISRGAFGLWIEGGEIVHPVSEITISGNLEAILSQVEMIGNDLEYRSAVSGPTIRVAELTVAGE